MTALVLRGLAERRLRSVLTGLAVLLGVAMIAGTYVQTDQIRHAFNDIEQTANRGNDLVITARQAFQSDLSYALPTLPASTVDRVAAVDGVARAEGQLQESGSLVLRGKRVGSKYAPGIVISDAGAPFNPLRYRTGRRPGTGEISVNAKLAAEQRLRIGQQVAVATRTGVQQVRIAGVFDYGNVSSIGGATIIVAPLAAIQRWYGEAGRVTSVVASAKRGVTPDALARRAGAALPALQVRTGAEQATHDSNQINDALGRFLTPMLLALAGAALLVGAFIIFNTFSITVAQRVREFALLRSLGATRRQIVAAVTGEALLVGGLASILGIGAGLAFATGLGGAVRRGRLRHPAQRTGPRATDRDHQPGGGRRRDARRRAHARATGDARAEDDLLRADYVIAAASVEPLPAGAGPAIDRATGVQTSAAILFDRVQVDGAKVKGTTDTLEGVDSDRLAQVYRFDWIHGSDRLASSLGLDDALVEQQFAEAHGLALGQTFRIQTSSGRATTLRAVGEYKDPQVLQGMMVAMDVFRRVSTATDPYLFLVRAEPGASPAAVHTALETSLRPYPAAEVKSNSEYRKDIEGQLDQMANMLYALLAMSVLISVCGIANSLYLSVHERTREFGLLRAIGTTGPQIKRIVRYESVITAVIGGVLGIAIGLAFAWLMVQALKDLGFGYAVPVMQLVGFLVVAVVVGIAAAAWPARRSARIDVLEALRYE